MSGEFSGGVARMPEWSPLIHFVWKGDGDVLTFPSGSCVDC